eukprot:CAMPEP_0176060884 /NCGR_PEP_ID=MMETSP0120_2-20121206/30351_1 /TAXON_ID=160619 /ORGANISM="Kryptoperidinium foliaceum, Strain CCMP 1326" /LENGTH=158 /DNA_ID=CAMNT_0017394435 /DNA_START=983 /DNA_END=1459 /DNA_ORIENTATION=+
MLLGAPAQLREYVRMPGVEGHHVPPQVLACGATVHRDGHEFAADDVAEVRARHAMDREAVPAEERHRRVFPLKADRPPRRQQHLLLLPIGPEARRLGCKQLGCADDEHQLEAERPEALGPPRDAAARGAAGVKAPQGEPLHEQQVHRRQEVPVRAVCR